MPINPSNRSKGLDPEERAALDAEFSIVEPSLRDKFDSFVSKYDDDQIDDFLLNLTAGLIGFLGIIFILVYVYGQG